MKIVISPAKSLDYESKVMTDKYTQPAFLEQSEKLSNVLKKKSARQLSKLMSISDNLGQLNYERNQNWSLPFTLENSRQAIFAFSGAVFQGIDVATIPTNKLLRTI